MSQTIASNVITLKGSTAIVTEFFNYSVNSILYQRGIYPPESFRKVTNYNLSLMVTTEEKLIGYLDNVLKQLEGREFSTHFWGICDPPHERQIMAKYMFHMLQMF